MRGGKFLAVRLGDERFGVNAMTVQEIVVPGPIRPVPGTPPHVRGVMNLRGSIVAVLDLKARLGMSPLQTTATTCVVVVDALSEPCGFLVDEIYEVIELADDAVSPPPAMAAGVPAEQLAGVARYPADGSVLLLLEIVNALRDPVAGADTPPPTEAR